MANAAIDAIMPKYELIPGYKPGSNITLLNTIYIKSQKDELGKYGMDWIYIIYKDLDTGEKKMHAIEGPTYRYYITKPEYAPQHNLFYIEAEKVRPVKCKFRDLRKSIAKETGTIDWFMDCVRNGDFKSTDKLFELPYIFEADLDIEDFYRFEFGRIYKNDGSMSLTKAYLDIEVDTEPIGGEFPQPGQCPVNALSLVNEVDNTVYSFLLEDDTNPLIKEFKNTQGIQMELKNFVQQAVGGWKQEKRFGLADFKYKIIFFRDEFELIRTVFALINNTKPDIVCCWNAAFDLPYLIARIAKLGHTPESVICHTDFPVPYVYYYIDTRAEKFEERSDDIKITSYTVYVDQLILFASRRKGQRMLGSYKLDTVGEFIADVHKLDYSHITRNLSKLPRLDYKTFAFYNVMDTIVQKCIEARTTDLDFLINKSLVTNTRLSRIHRQTTYLKNRAVSDFAGYGYVLGCNANRHNQKIPFAGAYVADPLNVSDNPKLKINNKAVGICDNLVDMDFTAMELRPVL